MTPPDSDAPLCIVCWLPATRGLPEDGGKLFWCDKHGPFYDKPDSDAHEVRTHTRDEREEADRVQEACTAEHAGPYVTICLDCAQKRSGVSLPLAQRILAALEGEAAFLHNEGKESGSRMLYAVAAELRAVIGK